MVRHFNIFHASIKNNGAILKKKMVVFTKIAHITVAGKLPVLKQSTYAGAFAGSRLGRRLGWLGGGGGLRGRSLLRLLLLLLFLLLLLVSLWEGGGSESLD